MKSYAPLANTIVYSSLWEEPYPVRILFMTIISQKDKDGFIHMSAKSLARVANMTYDETVAALKVLENPDTKTDRPQEYDGKRIEKTETGWRVLNHQKYQDAMIALNKKRADYMKTYRAKKTAIKKSVPLPGEQRYQQLLREHGREVADAYMAEYQEIMNTPPPSASDDDKECPL